MLYRSFLNSRGAGEEIRTPDLRITNALLYQLSHTSSFLDCEKYYITNSAYSQELIFLLHERSVLKTVNKHANLHFMYHLS